VELQKKRFELRKLTNDIFSFTHEMQCIAEVSMSCSKLKSILGFPLGVSAYAFKAEFTRVQQLAAAESSRVEQLAAATVAVEADREARNAAHDKEMKALEEKHEAEQAARRAEYEELRKVIMARQAKNRALQEKINKDEQENAEVLAKIKLVSTK